MPQNASLCHRSSTPGARAFAGKGAAESSAEAGAFLVTHPAKLPQSGTWVPRQIQAVANSRRDPGENERKQILQSNPL